jgi:hypothetical protein
VKEDRREIIVSLIVCKTQTSIAKYIVTAALGFIFEICFVL